jgi:hypothetical protein
MKYYKALVIVFTILLYQCKSVNTLSKKEDNSMDLYLCIGQSNMAGRAPIELQDKDSLVNVFLFTGNKEKAWEHAANPLNKYSSIRKGIKMQGLGPSYGFAKQMSNIMPDKKIGLIVNAKGGTSIEEWAYGTLFYEEAVNRVKTAMKYGELKGVIWHQGESNSRKHEQYMPQIVALIKAIRADLNMPNLPFVTGQLSLDKPERKYFNSMIIELSEKVENTAVITSENTSTTDNTHFDSASQRLLGKRYATEMLKLIWNK